MSNRGRIVRFFGPSGPLCEAQVDRGGGFKRLAFAAAAGGVAKPSAAEGAPFSRGDPGPPEGAGPPRGIEKRGDPVPPWGGKEPVGPVGTGREPSAQGNQWVLGVPRVLIALVRGEGSPAGQTRVNHSPPPVFLQGGGRGRPY